MNETPMMECGHAANAKGQYGEPVCAICMPKPASRTVAEDAPGLAGRVARCSCGRELPSSAELPFFEYLGPGSRQATEACANCGFHRVAHGPDGNPNSVAGRGPNVCWDFTPKGDVGHDRFYCGCRGWD